MRVFGWAADMQGCGYYRLARPYKELRDAGVEAHASMRIPLDVAAESDLIVGQRLMQMSSSRWWRQQDPARLVYEIDDDLWRVPEWSDAHRGMNRTIIHNSMTANLRHSGAVTVSTEPLADVIREQLAGSHEAHRPSVHVIPNYVDAMLLDHDRIRNEQLTVGWAGSATHRRDFEMVAPALARFLGKYPAVGMHFVGVDYSPLIRRTSRVTPWVPSVHGYYGALDFDIGLAPLTSHVFNESKSHIKVLEYAALGIPVIASDYGPYRGFVQHGVTGFLCRTDHDWFRALRTLTEDASLRETMGKAARELAAEHTVQGNAWRWAEVYEKLVA